MSEASEIQRILEPKQIKVIGELFFQTPEAKIAFLNKIQILEKNSIHLSYINQDIVDILLGLSLNETDLKKLRKINWDDFTNLLKDHLKGENKRKEKIYFNFLYFLKKELGVKLSSEDKQQKHLIEELDLKEHKKTSDFTFDDSLLEMKENFDREADLKAKIEKYDVEVKFDYTEHPHKLKVNDFTLYFNQRLNYFTKLLSSRVDTSEIMRINQLKDIYETNNEVIIIGLISEINQTKNGHYMITLEDKSGAISCFVNKDKAELVKHIENFCLDEGIAVKGKIGKEIIWTDEFIIPSPPNEAELKRTEEEHYLCFISDLHFGANVFQDEAFQKFLDFLNGESSNEKLNNLAKKIKHVIIPGDIIEGIGIYPGQGADARILSTELQYHEAARWLSQIPEDKSIIICPGNHDTDRLSEPQPKLPYHKAYALYNMKNTIMISNPGIVKVFPQDPSGGLDVYMYHGGSLFYYADKIKHLREKGGAKVPEEVVKYLLEKRHLAPSHGATLYIPDSQNDPLVIKKMPDIFVTGHTHKLSLVNYKGCTIASCGCWVEMSDYQEKMGMFPDVGKCILLNTKTRKPSILSFYSEKHKQEK